MSGGNKSGKALISLKVEGIQNPPPQGLLSIPFYEVHGGSVNLLNLKRFGSPAEKA